MGTADETLYQPVQPSPNYVTPQQVEQQQQEQALLGVPRHPFVFPSMRETYELTKTSRSWKIHVYGVAALSLACYFVWFILDWFTAHFPWFIWVWGGALLSLCLHYFMIVKQKEHVQWHFSSFAVVVACLMLTWLSTGGHYLWFLIVALSWAQLLNLHYHLAICKTQPDKYLSIHRTGFLLLQAMFFLIWVQSSRAYPWFLITFFAMGLLYVIHYASFHYPQNYFKMHLGIFLDVQLMLYVIWAASGPAVPWFVFPLGCWGALVYFHWVTYTRKAKKQPILPTSTNDVNNANNNNSSFTVVSPPNNNPAVVINLQPQPLQVPQQQLPQYGTYVSQPMYPQLQPQAPYQHAPYQQPQQQPQPQPQPQQQPYVTVVSSPYPYLLPPTATQTTQQHQ